MSELRVELYGVHIGTLVGADRRTFDFVTDANAIAIFGLGSTVLSESVPFDLIANRAKAGRRRNFFSELLPEGIALESLAAEIRVSTDDTIALLRRFGRDVAGAVQIYDPTAPGEPRTPELAPVDAHAIGTLLANPQLTPLGNDPRRGRTSLAGVQEKIVLARVDDAWFQALDGYPSTHIIKPPSQRHPTITFDEEYGFRAARAAGLTDREAWMESFDGIDALIIERFDRSRDNPLERIHQEDMNQALGASKNEKYQEYGGKISLKRIAEVVRRSAGREDTRQLLRAVTVAQALGNLDMHGKNISVLRLRDGTVRLTPAYDVVPQTHLDSDGKMALAINKHYAHAMITRGDLIDEGASWGIRDARDVVDETLHRIETFVRSEAPLPGAYPQLQSDIATFTRNLLLGKSAGGVA